MALSANLIARHWLALAERIDWLDRQHNGSKTRLQRASANGRKIGADEQAQTKALDAVRAGIHLDHDDSHNPYGGCSDNVPRCVVKSGPKRIWFWKQ
jgi:hypothetical protein